MGVIIEGILAALSRLVATRLGPWLVQALLFFGVQLVASKIVLGPVKATVSAGFAGMPADILAWISYIQVDRALTIILSAYAASAGTRFFMSRK